MEIEIVYSDGEKETIVVPGVTEDDLLEGPDDDLKQAGERILAELHRLAAEGFPTEL